MNLAAKKILICNKDENALFSKSCKVFSAIFQLLDLITLLILCGGRRRYYKSTVGNQYPQSI